MHDGTGSKDTIPLVLLSAVDARLKGILKVLFESISSSDCTERLSVGRPLTILILSMRFACLHFAITAESAFKYAPAFVPFLPFSCRFRYSEFVLSTEHRGFQTTRIMLRDLNVEAASYLG